MLQGEAKQVEDYLQFVKSQLFNRVQMSACFQDSKTFADANPKREWSAVLNQFENSHPSNSELAEFVNSNFELRELASGYKSNKKLSMLDYIASFWIHLVRAPDKPVNNSSIRLRFPYIVPGGRFQEIYYWDTYFTALGLIQSDYKALVLSMIENLVDIQSRFNIIPNGNRKYYLSRSQPPFFPQLLELYIDSEVDDHTKIELINRYYDAAKKEYDFWMKGSSNLNANNPSERRVVRMPGGEYLNRYWDDQCTPRPESFREDVELANYIEESRRSNLYRNIRAACESGWDFSSRWLENSKDLTTIETTKIVPVDLNCILYKNELLLGVWANMLGMNDESAYFKSKASNRKNAIEKYFWDEAKGFYFDYHLVKRRQKKAWTLAGLYPLFVKASDNDKATKVAFNVSDKFLKHGGVVTSLTASGQQWDMPIGWAPLQWITFKGLVNYNFNTLAKNIAEKWIETTKTFFEQKYQMMEKYNLQELNKTANEGEYPVQHGFGWTNGVTLALLDELDRMEN